MQENEEKLWTDRYLNHSTGWDIGHASTPLEEYFDQLTNKSMTILIPGAGNAHEAEYLHKHGFTNVVVLDISAVPLQSFAERLPDFPKEHLIQDDFFKHKGQYDLIIEQTFFCSFPPTPERRREYMKKMHSLLISNGKLIGLWFCFPLTDDMVKRPFGGSLKEYEKYLQPYFDTLIFEPCYNSIKPRRGKELFGIFRRKD